MLTDYFTAITQMPFGRQGGGLDNSVCLLAKFIDIVQPDFKAEAGAGVILQKLIALLVVIQAPIVVLPVALNLARIRTSAKVFDAYDAQNAISLVKASSSRFFTPPYQVRKKKTNIKVKVSTTRRRILHTHRLTSSAATLSL